MVRKNPGVNPFESKTRNRTRFQVLNRQKQTSNIRTSKNVITKRQKILLDSLKNSNKDNKFIDKRIDNKNKIKSNADIQLERYKAEKIRKIKKSTKLSKFNLQDDDDDILTHEGKILDTNDIKKYEINNNNDSDNDYDDIGRIETDEIKQTHFGGGILDKDKSTIKMKHPMTHKEILANIIQKSKLRKLEKHELTKKMEIMNENIETSFKDIKDLLPYSKSSIEYDKKIDNLRKSNRLPIGLDGKILPDIEKYDDFSSQVQQMSIQARVAPSKNPSIETEYDKACKERDELLKNLSIDNTTTNDNILIIPTKYIDFCTLINTDINNFEIIINRQQILYNIKLDESNCYKIEQLCIYIFRYINTLYDKIKKNETTILKNIFIWLESITRCIHKICKMIPEQCSNICGNYLQQLLKNYNQRILQDDKQSKYPPIYESLAVRIITTLYPVNSTRHRIISTIILYWTHILLNTPIYTLNDIINGIFIVANLVQYIQSTRRWIPECMIFLETILRWSFNDEILSNQNAPDNINNNNNDSGSIVFYKDIKHWEYLLKDSNRKMMLHISVPYINDTTNNEIENIIPLYSSYQFTDIPSNYRTLTSIRWSILELIDKLITQYKEQNTFPEIFGEQFVIIEILSNRCKNLQSSLIKKSNDIYKKMLNIINTYHIIRKPLIKFNKIQPIITKEPKIDEPNDNLQIVKDFKEIHKSTKESLKKLKRQKRSTIREIRRDTAFVNQIQQKQKEQKRVSKISQKKYVQNILQSDNRDTNKFSKVSKRKIGKKSK